LISSLVSTKDLLAEVVQAIVALVVLVPSMFILVFQVTHDRPADLPGVLAGFDGVVLTFYFARAAARQLTNGLTKAANSHA